MRALVKHQDPTGMWHQVIDDDSSYREMSCTCMITFAMIRGVRNGWLDEATCRPVIEKAFRAIKTRIATDGTLVDVCTGTGKQKTLRDYYDRKAILGRDARGGAMALIVTTEMARWQPK
jgi:rhamnogalacturonyl hydrolase YesR